MVGHMASLVSLHAVSTRAFELLGVLGFYVIVQKYLWENL